MVAFCSYFPWCTPDVFWNLDYDDYRALAAHLNRVAREQRRQQRRAR